MSEYQRTTRECPWLHTRPELAAAICTHIEKYGLEDAFAAPLICCETISTRQKKKLFRTTTEVVASCVVLAPQWLLYASGREGEPVGVLSERLSNLRAEDYETSSMYKLMEDTGVNLSGFQTGNGLGTVFVGLGPEAVANRFRELLKEALASS